MAPGETLKGTINVPSDMDAFQFIGGAGQRVVINAVTTSGSLDTGIDLYPPSGPMEATSNGYGGGDQLDHALAQSGLYTIVIRDYSLSRTGTYNLTLLKFPGPVSYPGDMDGGDITSGDLPTRGSIGLPSDADVYQFWGQKNDQVIITAVTTSGRLDTGIDLYPPSGPMEVTSNGYGGGDRLDHALAQTGSLQHSDPGLQPESHWPLQRFADQIPARAASAGLRSRDRRLARQWRRDSAP